MATITKRKGKYQVQIRRVGQPFTAKSFSYLADAKHWALQIESSLEAQISTASPTATLKQ